MLWLRNQEPGFARSDASKEAQAIDETLHFLFARILSNHATGKIWNQLILAITHSVSVLSEVGVLKKLLGRKPRLVFIQAELSARFFHRDRYERKFFKHLRLCRHCDQELNRVPSLIRA